MVEFLLPFLQYLNGRTPCDSTYHHKIVSQSHDTRIAVPLPTGS